MDSSGEPCVQVLPGIERTTIQEKTVFDTFVEETGEFSLKYISYAYNDRVRGNKVTRFTFQLRDLSTNVSGVVAEFSDEVIIPFMSISCSSPGCIHIYSIPGKNCDDDDGSYQEFTAQGECVLGRGSTSTTSEYTFRCVSHHAERISEAMKHAIKLSGGKDELF